MAGQTVPSVDDWRTQETITVDEWCAIWRTSRFNTYRNLKAGKIPGTQVGGSWRIPVRWARVQLGEIEDPAYQRVGAQPTAAQQAREGAA